MFSACLDKSILLGNTKKIGLGSHTVLRRTLAQASTKNAIIIGLTSLVLWSFVRLSVENNKQLQVIHGVNEN